MNSTAVVVIPPPTLSLPPSPLPYTLCVGRLRSWMIAKHMIYSLYPPCHLLPFWWCPLHATNSFMCQNHGFQPLGIYPSRVHDGE